MAEFYVSDNKIYMDDGTVSLHIADLRPELTETLKAEVAENLEADRVEIDELISNLSAAESSLDDARCEISSVRDDLQRCRK